jgi:Domain of unknown function (DUF1772)
MSMAFTLLQAASLAIVAIALAPALAHALELPGKLRLGREDYLTVQAIYYPGFTRAGIAEPASSLALLLLAFLTPAGTAAFWLTLAALVATLAMQAIFWLRTQPVNRIWVRDLDLGRADAAFFGTGPSAGAAADWTVLRDRWEGSHVARAACAAAAFLLLAIAVAL